MKEYTYNNTHGVQPSTQPSALPQKPHAVVPSYRYVIEGMAPRMYNLKIVDLESEEDSWKEPAHEVVAEANILSHRKIIRAFCGRNDVNVQYGPPMKTPTS